MHFGKFPNMAAEKDADLVIRIVEFIVAKTLGLSASNVFNTLQRLEEFLKEETRT